LQDAAGVDILGETTVNNISFSTTMPTVSQGSVEIESGSKFETDILVIYLVIFHSCVDFALNIS
jgi:hypothetical protein